MKAKETDNTPACPACGEKTATPIAYGHPTEETFEEADRGNWEGA